MKFGLEGGYATPTNKHEKSVLTPEEKVESALTYNLEGDALSTWMAMKAANTPVASFLRWVEDFNTTSPEDRGKDKYDHSRPLEEHVDITTDVTTGSGYPLSVTLHKNGEITFATPLADA